MFSDLPFLEFNHRPTEYDDIKNYIKPHERAWSLEQYPMSKLDNEERLVARISEEIKNFDEDFNEHGPEFTSDRDYIKKMFDLNDSDLDEEFPTVDEN